MSGYCPNCGAGVPEGARFCANCGRAFPQAEPAPQQPSQEAATPPQQPVDAQAPVDLPPPPQAGPPPINVPPPPQQPAGGGRRGRLILGVGCATLLGVGLMLVALVFLLALCGGGGSAGGEGGGSGGGEDAAEAGVARGTVTDSQGQPLEGAKITVYGISTEAGSNIMGSTQTDADGAYSLEVPDGELELSASIPIDYEGQHWNSFPLHPADGEPMGTPFDGADGVVRDYVWKLEGLMPGKDPNTEVSYYGGHITVSFTEEEFGTTPEDAAFSFALTPTEPLADGSEGETLVFERTYAQLSGQDDDSSLDTGGSLYDIPLGISSCVSTLPGRGTLYGVVGRAGALV